MLWSRSQGKSDFTPMPRGDVLLRFGSTGYAAHAGELRRRKGYRGEGVFEMRVAFGPGYRIYCAEDGKRIVVLLCGGSKRSQAKDIGRARVFWNEYKRLIDHA